MRLAVLAVVVGACGRIGFDSQTTIAGEGDGTPQPNLRELLPGRASGLVGYWRMQGDWSDAGPLGNDLVVDTGTPMFSPDAAIGSQVGQFYDASLVVTNRPSLDVAYLSFSVWFTS